MTTVEEIFKPIKGTQSHEISNLGRVRRTASWGYNEAGSLRPLDGYIRLTISESKKIGFTLHKLVAETFLENPNKLSFIIHKNGNVEDNRASNLEYIKRPKNFNTGIYEYNGKYRCTVLKGEQRLFIGDYEYECEAVKQQLLAKLDNTK